MGHPATHFDIYMLGVILLLLLVGLCWPGGGSGPDTRVSWGRM